MTRLQHGTFLPFALLLAVACGSPGAEGNDGGDGHGPHDGDAGAPVEDAGGSVLDAGAPADAGGQLPDAGHTPDAGTGTPDAGSDDTTPDAGTETPDAGTETPDAGPPPRTLTRFVALGDTGKDNDAQMAVANAMKTVCTNRGGCDFGILLGDNFYPSGVSAADDEMFDSMFVKQYGQLGFPFFPALGNHDYGGDGAGYELWRGEHQVDYSARNPQWVMPSAHHHYTQPFLDLFVLDTNTIFLIGGNDQRTWIREALGTATQPWKIAYGHHEYLSNGRHGNAGNYDWVPSLGGSMKTFVEGELCGKVDAYLCGHDHNMQDLGEVCGTQFLVSGAGASTTGFRDAIPFVYEPNDHEWQDDSIEGFLLVEATATTLSFTFFNKSAAQLHTRTITK